jgi:hypothetical protein
MLETKIFLLESGTITDLHRIRKLRGCHWKRIAGFRQQCCEVTDNTAVKLLTTVL